MFYHRVLELPSTFPLVRPTCNCAYDCSSNASFDIQRHNNEPGEMENGYKDNSMAKKVLFEEAVGFG